MFGKIHILLLIALGLFIWGKECSGTRTSRMDKEPFHGISACDDTPGFVGNPLIPLLTHHIGKKFRKKYKKKKIMVSMNDIQEMLNMVKQNDKYKEKDLEEFVQALLKDNKDDKKKISEVKWRQRLIRVRLFPRKSKSRKRSIEQLGSFMGWCKKIFQKVVGFFKGLFKSKKKLTEEKAKKRIFEFFKIDKNDKEFVLDKFDKLFNNKNELVKEIRTIIVEEKYFTFLLISKELIGAFQIMINRLKSEDTNLLFKGMANSGLKFTARALLILIQIVTLPDLLKLLQPFTEEYDADTFVPNLKRTLKHCMFFDDALYEARRKQNSDNRLAHPPISEVIYTALYEAKYNKDEASKLKLGDVLMELKLVSHMGKFFQELENITDDKIIPILDSLCIDSSTNGTQKWIVLGIIVMFCKIEKDDYITFSRILIHIHLSDEDASFHYFLKVILKLIHDCEETKIMATGKKLMNNIDKITTLYTKIKQYRDKLKSESKTPRQLDENKGVVRGNTVIRSNQ